MTTLMLGTDPEGFLKLGDKFLSAAGLFPGTKENPFKVDKGAIQVDGLALEFNIDPAEDAETFDRNIETVVTQIKEMSAKIDKDIEYVFTPVARFDPEYFQSIAPEAKILGCTPDFMHNGKMTTIPENQAEQPIRTAAGHIHIGWMKDAEVNGAGHFEDCRFVSSKFYYDRVFQATTHDEFERLKYYGNYGAFRPKSYGVELRQPSNLWVRTSKERQDMFNKVVDKMRSFM